MTTLIFLSRKLCFHFLFFFFFFLFFFFFFFFIFFFFFFFNDTATTEIYTVPYHSFPTRRSSDLTAGRPARRPRRARRARGAARGSAAPRRWPDRKSTRLNSSHTEQSRMPSSA